MAMFDDAIEAFNLSVAIPVLGVVVAAVVSAVSQLSV